MRGNLTADARQFRVLRTPGAKMEVRQFRALRMQKGSGLVVRHLPQMDCLVDLILSLWIFFQVKSHQ